MVWTPTNHGDTCTKPRGAASAWKASPGGSNSFWPSSIPSRRRGDTEWSCRVVRFFFDPDSIFWRRPKLWMLQTTRRWVPAHRWCWGMWDLDVASGCRVLFDCHLIQVPNFQKLSWNRIYPEAPLPKKLTAFGNLEDVKPPCQLGGDTSYAYFSSNLQPSKNQLLQPGQHAHPFWISSWAEAEAGAAGADGLWWGMEGRIGGVGPSWYAGIKKSEMVIQ